MGFSCKKLHESSFRLRSIYLTLKTEVCLSQLFSFIHFKLFECRESIKGAKDSSK